jgi:predicted GNAT superfamily acetyltransferase
MLKGQMHQSLYKHLPALTGLYPKLAVHREFARTEVVAADRSDERRVYCSICIMPEAKFKPTIMIRDLRSLDDLKQVEAVEKEVWALSDLDTMPLTLTIATRESGSIWIGAFDGPKLVGFTFGILGLEGNRPNIHSHMLAVLEPYRSLDLGNKLKLAQRERALSMRVGDVRIAEITWTFDPLQSRNAHLNFAKLGVVSDSYKIDFYGPETSSVLHRNGTDRLWVKWPIGSRRVQGRIQGRDNRSEMLDTLKTLSPLVSFNGDGRPHRGEHADAVQRQRIAIEIPSDILAIEREEPALAHEWRMATRWAFTEALKAGFFVAEFCRTVRGQQGPGVYLLEKGRLEEYVPELAGY